MVYLVWAPALTASASVLFGLGRKLGTSLSRHPHRPAHGQALADIGYPALPLRPVPAQR